LEWLLNVGIHPLFSMVAFFNGGIFQWWHFSMVGIKSSSSSYFSDHQANCLVQ